LRLHVCHVWERFWPLEIGGLERYIMGLSSYLHRKEEIDFSLVTGRTQILHIIKNIKKIEDSGYIKVYRLGPRPIDLINGFFMYSLKWQPKYMDKLKLASLCQEARGWKTAQTADLFHIHGIWADLEYIWLGVYLSQRYHKPLVVTLHGSFVGDPLHGGMPLESAPVREILSSCDAITTYSKEVLGVLQRMGFGGKSHFITNFVDTPHFKKPSAGSSASGDIAIYVGRLEQVTNPDLPIQAFKYVHKEYPNAKLHIIGYGRLFERLKQLVHELELDETVILMGKQTDVKRFLWQSDIFIATNFGYIASLEAWSAGLAVIAPDFGIMKETIQHGENGLLVPPQNAQALATAIISLLRDKQLREKLAANGSETVKDFDIRLVAPKIAAVYRSVL
jgi:glycosyltransferase involved in cell wall biosynthesis